MSPEKKGACLLLAAAGAVVALLLAVWIYSAALRPGQGLPEGGCSLVLVSLVLIAGFVAGALWLVRQSDD